jgi:DNA-binding CsgD family transcriptional regulator
MRVFISEIDIDILYRVARGEAYKQIALAEGLAEQTVKERMMSVLQSFGAKSMAHCIAMLIASDILRLSDLYQEIDLVVREYRRGGRSTQSYNLHAYREGA